MRSAFFLVVVLILLCALIGGWTLYTKRLQPPAPSPTSAQAMPTIPSSTLPTKYISTVDWPPQMRTENTPFSCTEAGSESERAGRTEKIVVNGHTYCVTKVTEGAAGSVYTQYAYARAENNNIEIFTFSLRFVQCGNYQDPEKSACEAERESFNVDNYTDQYIQSNF
jgi:hypothetical protein